MMHLHHELETKICLFDCDHGGMHVGTTAFQHACNVRLGLPLEMFNVINCVPDHLPEPSL